MGYIFCRNLAADGKGPFDDVRLELFARVAYNPVKLKVTVVDR